MASDAELRALRDMLTDRLLAIEHWLQHIAEAVEQGAKKREGGLRGYLYRLPERKEG